MSDSVAVVTGGSAGIGHAVGERLHRSGYRVISIARQQTETTAWGPDQEYQADVTDADALDGVARDVLATFGHVDALVTCAGMVLRGPLAEAPLSQLTRQVEVNLLGTMFACRAFTPALQRSGGAIVTLSSSIAANPQPSAAAYAAAKGGVESFSRALAVVSREVGDVRRVVR